MRTKGDVTYDTPLDEAATIIQYEIGDLTGKLSILVRGIVDAAQAHRAKYGDLSPEIRAAWETADDLKTILQAVRSLAHTLDAATKAMVAAGYGTAAE